MRRWIAWLWLLSGAAALAGGGDVKLDIRRFRLENGLEVVLAPRRDTPIIHSLVRYRVGSANEHTGITGVSHMLEHMMFKGTRELQTTQYEAELPVMQKQDDLFREVLKLRRLKLQNRAPDRADQQVAELLLKIKGLNLTQKIVTVQNETDVATFQVGFSRLNADTSFDRTHYMEFFPSNCLEAWAYFEAARMKDPVFREFHSERDVLLEERRQTTETQADGVLEERFLSAAFTAHTYQWPVIGWRSDIENYTRADVSEYHRMYYAPNNAIVVLAGDFSAEVAEALVRKYFSRIPPQQVPRPMAMTEEPPQKGEGRVRVRFQATPRLTVGFHRCAATHPDYAVWEVLGTLLAGGRGAPFHKELIASGLAAGFSVGNAEMKRYPGLFSVSVTAAESASLRKLESVVLGILDKVKTEPVPARSLEAAKSRLLGDALRDLADGERLAALLAEGVDFFDDPLAFEGRLRRIQEVSSDDIRRVAQQSLVVSNRTVVWLSPDPESEDRP